MRPDFARSSSAIRNWKIQLASSCGWLVPRKTLFSRRQLRIARSVCGTSAGVVAFRRRAAQATPCTTAYTTVRTSSVTVSQTSTCLATSTASAGVTNTIAAAMKAPKSAQRPTVTIVERPKEATRSVSPGWCRLASSTSSSPSRPVSSTSSGDGSAAGAATSVCSPPSTATALLTTWAIFCSVVPSDSASSSS